MINPFRYLYGPVYSWRLGRSLGIDPLGQQEKICNMNCSYCQLGKTAHLCQERQCYVPTEEIVEELSRIPVQFIDYITISGRGEPTLAQNLGDIIHTIKKTRHEKIAVITNGILLRQPRVRLDLMAADYVLVKLDAANQKTFEAVDGTNVNFDEVVDGIASFRREFAGKLALQVMLIDNNFDNLDEIACLARAINPDEIQLNTPTRPCGDKPIERVRMDYAKKFFWDMPVVSVYDHEQKTYTPIDEQATKARHGNYRKTRYY